MVNAWSLAASILNGTFDKDYPIMKKEKFENDGLDYENDYMSSSADYMSDVDDQRAHHFSYYDDGFTLQAIEESEKRKRVALYLFLLYVQKNNLKACLHMQQVSPL